MSGSRRRVSRSSASCFRSRMFAALKIAERSTPSTTAADTVTTTRSRHASPAPAMIGAASRRIWNASTTSPPWRTGIASINVDVPEAASLAIHALGRPSKIARVVCPGMGAAAAEPDAARTAAPRAEITSTPT